MCVCLLGGLILVGCSTKHYRASADKEAASVIAEKTPAVPNMDPKFTIEQAEKASLEELPPNTKVEDFFGPNEGELEKDARIISLEKALELATKFNRNYQNRKEVLYLEALSLTLARHRFTPIFSAGATSAYSEQQTVEEVSAGVDTVVKERTVGVSPSAGADVLLRTGGRIAVDFTTDFLRYVSGDESVVTSSALTATLIQPLWRGAGYKAAMENLTQAERNLLYALRSFTQFRKDFSVDIASTYYQVLQNRDAVRNNWIGFQNFKLNVEREKAFADEGLRTQTALGQLRQAELTTELRWINAVRSYRQSLDQFKIQLGLSTDVHIILDDSELTNLQIAHPEINLEEAVKVALETRLDLYTVRDQYVDAARHIDVAANGLRPDVDLVLSGRVNSAPGSGFPEPDFDRYNWSAGLNLDLPLDRKAERNNYRATLIQHERARRELDLAMDQIRLDINDGWRNLDQARRNYEISEVGVGLSERRVEEQDLLTELGRGIARDLVDAQTDLINSRNARTTALVNHTIARLQFWRDMGILNIQENGKWEEVSHAQ